MKPNQTCKFLQSKGNHKKRKNEKTTYRRKYFQNGATDKGLIFKKYKQLLQVKNKTKSTIQK